MNVRTKFESINQSYSLIQQTVKLQLLLQYGIDKYGYK